MSCIVLPAAVLLGWTCSIPIEYGKAYAADVSLPRAADVSNSRIRLDVTNVPADTAHDQPLIVVGLAAGVHQKQGRALTWALKRTLDASVEWKSIEIRVDAEGLFVAAECPEIPEAACLTRLANKFNLPKFVWGSLKLRRGRVTAQLGIFDRVATITTAQLEYNANMIDVFDRDLLRLANEGLTQLLGPLHFPVLVRSHEPKGNVFVDEAVAGQLDEGVSILSVTAGDHQFRLVLPDSTVIARSFQVRVGTSNHIRLDFINIPET